MRVALVNEFWGQGAGSERLATAEQAALAARGHDVLFLYGALQPYRRRQGPDSGGASADAGGGGRTGSGSAATLLPHPETAWHAPGILQRAADGSGAGLPDAIARLEAFRPDVVHVHKCPSPRFLAALVERWPVVWTLHDHGAHCPGGTRMHWRSGRPCYRQPGLACAVFAYGERCAPRSPGKLLAAVRDARERLLLLERARLLCVLGDSMRAQLLALGVPAEKVRVVPPPIALPDLPPEPAEPAVLFLGRLAREKGPGCLLEALSRMREKPAAVFVGDGPERARLERRAERLGLASRVRFTGWLDDAGCSEQYARATVVAFPSLWPEPYGLVGPEALAHARPVVAFDVGGVRSWLEDGECGLVVPPGNVDALARALDLLLSDPARARAMGLRGRQRVAARHDPERAWSAVEALLAEARRRSASVTEALPVC